MTAVWRNSSRLEYEARNVPGSRKAGIKKNRIFPRCGENFLLRVSNPREGKEMKRLKSLHILYYLLSIKIQDIILDGEVSIIIQGVIDNKAPEHDLSRRVLP